MSSDRLSDEARDYFGKRFGVDRDTLIDLQFHEHGDDIWADTTSPALEIACRRPPGLRVLRRTPQGLKPTTAFLIHLGVRITASRVDLTLEELEAIVLGRKLDSSHSDGHVALCYRGDVIGCGRVNRSLLQAVIPTGRRRELLEALSEKPLETA
ncbi:MAG: hypothetical protein WBC63_08545 [Candidatus Bipolaricaulia bacterium]